MPPRCRPTSRERVAIRSPGRTAEDWTALRRRVSDRPAERPASIHRRAAGVGRSITRKHSLRQFVTAQTLSIFLLIPSVTTFVLDRFRLVGCLGIDTLESPYTSIDKKRPTRVTFENLSITLTVLPQVLSLTKVRVLFQCLRPSRVTDV